jgi:hypothetical protein
MRGLSGVSEKALLTNRLQDPRDHAVFSNFELMVREAQHAEALADEPGVAQRILLRIVEWAVRLDDEPVTQAEEIHDLGSDRNLSAKLQAL